VLVVTTGGGLETSKENSVGDRILETEGATNPSCANG